MMSITPKNWAAFQHYKHRNPPWIRLYRNILDNYEFSQLPVESRALAPLLWLIASEFERGEITLDSMGLAFRLRMNSKDIDNALIPLIAGGFFVASTALAPCLQDASEMLHQSRVKESKRKNPRQDGSYEEGNHISTGASAGGASMGVNGCKHSGIADLAFDISAGGASMGVNGCKHSGIADLAFDLPVQS